MHFLILKSVTPNSNYGQTKKGLQNVKNAFVAWATNYSHYIYTFTYSLWYVKIELSQNQDLSTSLKMPHNELLNALFNFEIGHS